MAAIRAAGEPAARRRSAGQSRTRRRFRNHDGLCRCGACATCADEARWERIFNEKFACPAYYGERHLQNWSTLARK